MSYSSDAVDCQTCTVQLAAGPQRRDAAAPDHSTCSQIQFVTHLYFIPFLFTLFPKRFIVLKLDISFPHLDSLLYFE